MEGSDSRFTVVVSLPYSLLACVYIEVDVRSAPPGNVGTTREGVARTEHVTAIYIDVCVHKAAVLTT